MLEINYNDIVQQYVKTVVLYKGKPVYVSTVTQDPPYKARILDLLTQKMSTVEFNLTDFTSPAFRIGMVNVDSSVVHISRIPVRKMQVGVNQNNIQVSLLPDAHYPEGGMQTANAAGKLNSLEVGNAILGIYPTFEECVAFVREFKGAMAWDRQFAITSSRMIYYRNKVVGTIPRNCTRKERIVFSEGYEHLNILIGDDFDAALQASRTK